MVSSRVKTLDSILKKLIYKPNHTFESLPDKVGVRVITGEIEIAREAILNRFSCLNEDDKAKELGPERLGYPGVHFDIELPPGDPAGSEFGGMGLRAEIQLRTHAQHAWCEVSHRFNYKSDIDDHIPQKLRRRLMLTIGLLEVADMNLADISNEMNALPAFRINKLLVSLEEMYFLLTARAPDRQLSMSTLTTLSSLYSGGPEELQQKVKAMFSEKKDVLRKVFERNERLDEPRAALFFQPETLAIYELLLEHKGQALLRAWREILPEDELFTLANEFGYSHSEIGE